MINTSRTIKSVIPETGGGNRSPLRDDLSQLVLKYLRKEITVINGSIETHLDNININAYKEVKSHTENILAFLDSDCIRSVSGQSIYSESVGNVTKKLLEFVTSYIRSYGVEISDEDYEKYEYVVSSFDMTKIDEYKKYVTLQRLLSRAEIRRSHGLLKSFVKCSSSFKDGTCYLNEEIVIIEWEHNLTICSYNALLSVRDVMLKRAIAIFASCDKLQTIGLYYPSKSTISSVLRWGSLILRKLGNDGFSIINTYESYLTGLILHKYDNFDNHEFFMTIYGEIAHATEADEEIMDQTDELESALRKEPRAVLIQCFSLFKMWSFPIVNEDEAMGTLIEYGRCIKEVNTDTMKTLNSLARRQFFLSHRIMFNRSPKMCCYIGDCGDHLYDVVANNKNFDSEADNYDLCQWENVILEGCVEPIFDVDIGSYMKDKAISPELSKLWTVYNREYVPDEVKSDAGCAVRSGIVRYISGDILKAQDLIRHIEQFGADEAWKVVGVTAKEKEHKPTARLFAMLTIHMKLWFAITEDCLKKALFKFFPEQSMDQTSTQASLKKRNMSKPPAPDHVKIIMNIDFSKWNTTFRYENTYLIFHFIDETFGFDNVYTYTHEFFHTCRVYISSKYQVPDVFKSCHSYEDSVDPLTNDVRWFYGFLGGFEGQRQKGWTLVTLLFMIYVLECKSKIKDYQLYGQGDNQVVCFEMKKSHLSDSVLESDDSASRLHAGIKQMIDKVKRSLVEGCKEMSLKVKIEETWFSSSFFQYSKDFYINGARMPLDMKQLISLSPHTKLIVPTQFDVYKTMVASLNACFDLSHNPLVTYLLGMHICNTLILADDYTYDRRPNFQKRHVELKSFEKPLRLINEGGELLLEMMSKIPSSLGGTCDLLLSNLIRKGAGDHTEAAIDILLRSGCIKSLDYLYTLKDSGMQESKDTDKSILIDNPFALNIKILEESKKILKDATTNYLKSKAGNQFKEALNDYTDTNHTRFKRGLVPDKDFNPVISKLMYNLSPYASISSQLERLDGTTLNRLAGVSLRSFMTTVHYDNSRLIESFTKRLTDKPLPTLIGDRSSSSIVKSLRRHWGLQELDLPCDKYNPDITISREMIEFKTPLYFIKVSSDVVPDNDRNLATTIGKQAYMQRQSNAYSSGRTNIEVPHGNVKTSMEELSEYYGYLSSLNNDILKKVDKQVSSVTDFKLDAASDASHYKEPRLLESYDVASSCNFPTHCLVYKSDKVKNEKDQDARNYYKKMKYLAVGLIQIGYLIKGSDQECKKGYWIYEESDRLSIPNIKCNFDVSILKYQPKHHFFVKSDALKYNDQRTRKTDDLLRCTMIVDRALASCGMMDNKGVFKERVPYSILNEDVNLYCMVVALRYMMVRGLSMCSTPQEIKDVVTKDIQHIIELFHWHLTDEGCSIVMGSNAIPCLTKNTLSHKALSLFLSGYSVLLNLKEYSRESLVRSCAIYFHNEYQYETMNHHIYRFLLHSHSGETYNTRRGVSELDVIRSLYQSVPVSYGRKRVIPRQHSNQIVLHKDIKYIKVCDSNGWRGHDYRFTDFVRDPMYVAMGLITSLISICSETRYKLVCIQLKKEDVCSILLSIIKGKKIHDQLNCTILVYTRVRGSYEIASCFGDKVLHVLTRFSRREGFHPLVREGVSILSFGSSTFGVPSLFVDDQSNVHSVFTDYIRYSALDRIEKYETENSTAMDLIPNWILSTLVSYEMKNCVHPDVEVFYHNSDEIKSAIVAHLNIGETEDDLSLYLNYNGLPRRLLHLYRSISSFRLQIIVERLGITHDELRSRGSWRYVERTGVKSMHIKGLTTLGN